MRQTCPDKINGKQTNKNRAQNANMLVDVASTRVPQSITLDSTPKRTASLCPLYVRDPLPGKVYQKL
jgi:hypothetical protein